MTHRLVLSVLVAICASYIPGQSLARLLSVTALEGTPGRIIAAPAQALDSAVASATHVLGFDERQNVLLTADLKYDGGTLKKGTRVNSHMILYNVPDESFGAFALNEWVFSGTVLGVMSDEDGAREAASSEVLGAAGTSYPPDGFFLRGFEESDGYEGVGTSRLRVWMSVWQPGDWIRVITRPRPIATHPAIMPRQPQLARHPDGKPSERISHGAR